MWHVDFPVSCLSRLGSSLKKSAAESACEQFGPILSSSLNLTERAWPNRLAEQIRCTTLSATILDRCRLQADFLHFLRIDMRSWAHDKHSKLCGKFHVKWQKGWRQKQTEIADTIGIRTFDCRLCRPGLPAASGSGNRRRNEQHTLILHCTRNHFTQFSKISDHDSASDEN